MNTWAIPLLRYSGPFLNWTGEKLKQKDQRKRKFSTQHQALPPRDDIDRYVSRKEGATGLASIEDNVGTLIRRLKDYIKKQQGKTGHNDHEQHKQHKDQKNNNN